MRSVLFVCLGNICRSPLGEGILRDLAGKKGMPGDLEIDSAGTGNWHVGNPPDPRSVEVAARHGIDISPLRARQVRTADFERFDLVLAMDGDNLAELRRRAGARAPALEASGRLRRFLDRDVPDPYYGGPGGFDDVFDMLRRGAERLLDELAAR
ncbi:MAG: protein tyrosine phosphatase [Stappia sp.]|uniref:low molecular weight protein-tyrosine-phosphatase n=1 Tax=Stappia sp. TaxID=1870903 RepID=UPI000C4D2B11|nr:low molecular weight protein-tyrosine-phosphatase [Stappia sp.]MAA99754.1 protein tyrosine phosphatase [Stappia sp.]MBM20443.1 protein tyrosine phosphatase [Stappia sp.]